MTEHEENNYIIADLVLIIFMVLGSFAQAGCLCRSSKSNFVQFGKLGHKHSTIYLMAGIYVFCLWTLATIALRLLLYYHACELIIDCQIKNISKIPVVDILQAGIQNGTSNTSTNAIPLVIFGGFCHNDVTFDVVRLLFTILQLSFIQTFREATFTRSILVQFTLYHTIMTNGCVWIRYVLTETHLFHGDEYHPSIYQFTTKAFHMEKTMTPFILEYHLLAAGLLYTISSHMVDMENIGTLRDGTLLVEHGTSTTLQNANANAVNALTTIKDAPLQIGTIFHQGKQDGPGSQPGLICGACFGLLLLLSSLMFSKEQTTVSKRSHDLFLAYEGVVAFLQVIAIVWTLSLLQQHRKSAHRLHSEDTLLMIGCLGTLAVHWIAIYGIIKVLLNHCPSVEGTDILTLLNLLALVVSTFQQTILVTI